MKLLQSLHAMPPRCSLNPSSRLWSCHPLSSTCVVYFWSLSIKNISFKFENYNDVTQDSSLLPRSQLLICVFSGLQKKFRLPLFLFFALDKRMANNMSWCLRRTVRPGQHKASNFFSTAAISSLSPSFSLLKLNRLLRCRLQFLLTLRLEISKSRSRSPLSIEWSSEVRLEK